MMTNLRHIVLLIIVNFLYLTEAKRGGGGGFRGAIQGGISSAARSAASAFRGGGSGLSLGGRGIGGRGGQTAISRARISTAAGAAGSSSRVPFFIGGGHGVAASVASHRLLVNAEKPIRVDDLAYYWQAPASPCAAPLAGSESESKSELKSGSESERRIVVSLNDSQANGTTEADCNRRLCSRALERNASDPLSAAVFSNGTRASVLFWTCPESLRCCEWECCDDSVISSENTSYGMFVYVFFGIPLIVGVAIVAYEARHALAAAALFNQAKKNCAKDGSTLRKQPSFTPL